MRIVEGILFAWNETGTEGNIPAVQDNNHIDPETGMWSYNGLIPLKDGQYLIVIDQDGTIVHRCEVSLLEDYWGRMRRQAFFSWKEWVAFLRKQYKCIIMIPEHLESILDA